MIKNLLLLILAAALFFAYQRWQESTEELETAETPAWESERPAGGGPVREWQGMPDAMSDHGRTVGQGRHSSHSATGSVKKKLGSTSD
jgi:hypothetical protein